MYRKYALTMAAPMLLATAGYTHSAREDARGQQQTMSSESRKTREIWPECKFAPGETDQGRAGPCRR